MHRLLSQLILALFATSLLAAETSQHSGHAEARAESAVAAWNFPPPAIK